MRKILLLLSMFFCSLLIAQTPHPTDPFTTITKLEFDTFALDKKFDSIRHFILSSTDNHDCNLIGEYNEDCSAEFGHLLYVDKITSLTGTSSCAGSGCHVVTNGYMPFGENIQAGTGFYWDGRQVSELQYFPYNLQDVSDVGTPTSKTAKYQTNLTSKGHLTKWQQASQKGGAFEHNINWQHLADSELYREYCFTCYGADSIQEVHFIQAIVDAQETLDFENDWTHLIKTGEGKNYLKKGTTIMFDAGCFNNCHVGLGLIDDSFGPAIIGPNGPEKLTADTCQVGTMHNWDYRAKVGYDEYYIQKATALKKHQKALMQDSLINHEIEGRDFNLVLKTILKGMKEEF